MYKFLVVGAVLLINANAEAAVPAVDENFEQIKELVVRGKNAGLTQEQCVNLVVQHVENNSLAAGTTPSSRKLKDIIVSTIVVIAVIWGIWRYCQAPTETEKISDKPVIKNIELVVEDGGTKKEESISDKPKRKRKRTKIWT